MSKDTSIEWADSSLNLEMGCDGCELWNPAAGNRHCYAGELTNRYGGRKGYPESFGKPALFLERLDAALRWPDLTGKDRPSKPWLNGLPRMVFLNDMGDTFTESLPLDWLAPLLPRMADSPHVFMVLTKRSSRMRQFSEQHPFPENFWPGVSVTKQGTVKRVAELIGVQGGGPKWISAEPLLGPVDLHGHVMENDVPYDWLDWISLVIVGCESGSNRRPMNPSWDRSLQEQCQAAGLAFFRKQMEVNGKVSGNMAEWPEALRVRQFPEVVGVGGR